MKLVQSTHIEIVKSHLKKSQPLLNKNLWFFAAIKLYNTNIAS